MPSASGTGRALANRVIGQLDTLHDAVTPQEFGRVMQRLLGTAFEAKGCAVTENAVGVPDLQVEVCGSQQRLAIEVKTGNPVVLSDRDLAGVTGYGQMGVVAALVFPDYNPRWLFVDAAHLSAGKMELRRLARLPQVSFAVDVQTSFLRIIDAVPARTLVDGDALSRWAEEQRRQGWPALADADMDRPVAGRQKQGQSQ